ncbi:MAG: hypothetical protein HY962_01395 [Ignavibacteriae bacterium]|nr:hypothetical protein [Ignavibacteriota bacterium]
MIVVSRIAALAVLSCFLYSCSDDTSLVDTQLPPQQQSFFQLSLPASSFDTDTMSIVAGRDKSPSDPIVIPIPLSVHTDTTQADQTRRVTRAWANVTVDGRSESLARADLRRVSNGYFEGLVELRISRGDVRDYRLNVEGSDAADRSAAQVHAKVSVTSGSRPPYFCGIETPDTVDVPTEGSQVLRITACVTDSSGRGDIKRVLFNSYLPNGQASVSNPFIMFDDGTHGDALAGDGTYTIDVQLPSTAARGRYRFEFFVYDLSNLSAFEARNIYLR